jgi:hypothetical protein
MNKEISFKKRKIYTSAYVWEIDKTRNLMDLVRDFSIPA